MSNIKQRIFTISENIKIDYLNNIYKDLHKSVLYEKRKEQIHKYLFNKYNLDAFTIILIDEHGENMLLNFHTDSWAMYNLDSYEKDLKLNIFFNDIALNNFNLLFTTGEGMDFIDFGTILTPSKEFLSSYIVGRKINGYSAVFYNKNTGYRINFLFAFKNQSILNINYNTYVNFIADLKKLIGSLDVFMKYFKEYKTIEDTFTLQKMIQEDESEKIFFN